MVALVCIAKNEDNYIQEWIDYNLKLGFDHIYIYMNDWRIVIDHPQVTTIEFDGKNKQREAYTHWLNTYRKQYNWAAFFDMDEFLVLKQNKTIQDFLLQYQNYNGVSINWHLFGNNGHTEVIDNQYSVIKRFTKRGSTMNEHVKTILNCKSNGLIDIHCPINITAMSPDYKVVRGPFNYKPDDSIAQINHYYCKTKEEFEQKCNRGRADTAIYRNTYEINYQPHNLNEVEDLTAYNFMYGN